MSGSGSNPRWHDDGGFDSEPMADIRRALMHLQDRNLSDQTPYGTSLEDRIKHIADEMFETHSDEAWARPTRADTTLEHMRSMRDDLRWICSKAETHGAESVATELKAIRIELADILPIFNTPEISPELLHLLSEIEGMIASISVKGSDRTGGQSSLGAGHQTSDVHRRFHEIVRTLSGQPDSSAMRAIAREVHLLGKSLDEFHTLHQDDTSSLQAMLEERLDEITRAIAALPFVDGRRQADSEAFERIEARIASLAGQINELINDRSSSDRSSSQRLEDLQQRFDQVMGVLEQEDDAERGEQLLATLDRHFAALHERIGEISHRHEGMALNHLETRLASIAEILGRDNNITLAEVTPRLDQIERTISQNRAHALETMQMAAEAALHRFLADGHDTLERGLNDEINRLKDLTQNSADRNARSFEAIHDSLLKIVERVAHIEDSHGANARPVDRERADTPSANMEIEPEHSATAAPPAHSSRDGLGSLLNVPRETRIAVAPRKGLLARFLSSQGRDEAPQIRAPRAPSAPPRSATAIVSDQNAVRGTDLINAARIAARLSAVEPSVEQLNGTPHRTRRGYNASLVAMFGITALISSALYVSGLRLSSLFPLGGSLSQSSGETTALINKPDTIQTGAIANPQTKVSATKETGGKILPPLKVPDFITSTTLRQAAEAGAPMALFEIGNRYARGAGTPSDLPEAAKWYSRAAEAGYAIAQYRLGDMYEQGQGVTRDANTARAWYEKSARSGNAHAMHNLAVLLTNGSGGERDQAKAIHWFNEAATLDVTDSQYNLGILAAKGEGMAADLIEAYKWLDITARKGDADAAERRDEIARVLSVADLERARGKSILWKARSRNEAANHYDPLAEWGDTSTEISPAPPQSKNAIRATN